MHLPAAVQVADCPCVLQGIDRSDSANLDSRPSGPPLITDPSGPYSYASGVCGVQALLDSACLSVVPAAFAHWLKPVPNTTKWQWEVIIIAAGSAPGPALAVCCALFPSCSWCNMLSPSLCTARTQERFDQALHQHHCG